MLCEDNGCVWRSSRIRSRRRGEQGCNSRKKKRLLRSSTIYEYVISVHTVAGAVRRCSTRAMCILRWSDSNHTNAGSARVAVPVSNAREGRDQFRQQVLRKEKRRKNQASTVLLEAFFAGKVFPLRKIRSSSVLLSLPCVVALLENGSTHNIARATLKSQCMRGTLEDRFSTDTARPCTCAQMPL